MNIAKNHNSFSNSEPLEFGNEEPYTPITQEMLIYEDKLCNRYDKMTNYVKEKAKLVEKENENIKFQIGLGIIGIISALIAHFCFDDKKDNNNFKEKESESDKNN